MFNCTLLDTQAGACGPPLRLGAVFLAGVRRVIGSLSRSCWRTWTTCSRAPWWLSLPGVVGVPGP